MFVLAGENGKSVQGITWGPTIEFDFYLMVWSGDRAGQGHQNQSGTYTMWVAVFEILERNKKKVTLTHVRLGAAEFGASSGKA
jgi:hypothetical protein